MINMILAVEKGGLEICSIRFFGEIPDISKQKMLSAETIP